MSLVPINQKGWIPAYHHHTEHIYILLTSLNLGGAEKIVSDQLWANHYTRAPQRITLIVIYDKDVEHSIPNSVNVVRLGGDLRNGKMLFQQIAYENKPLVCHLINDQIAQFLFDLNLHLHIVIHNDKRGWSNSTDYFNHPQVISLIAVCHYVKNQLQTFTEKPIITFRHQINQRQFSFKPHLRVLHREQLKLQDDDILIGMIGRICEQKNYLFALDVLATLVRDNPRYKLLILGGFEKMFFPLYLKIIQKINILKLHKNVILPGFKNNPQHWVNAFDIGLNTSYYEGLSMATQELMMNGLPIVLSKVCGQPEIFDPRHQLHFYDMPEALDTPETAEFSLLYDVSDKSVEKIEKYMLYMNQVQHVSSLIKEYQQTRIIFNDLEKQHISRMCYGSHEMWNLLNHIYPTQYTIDEKSVEKTAFLTSNLNLGGAQRSLINILQKFKEYDYHFPLIILNQSNQQQFYQTLIEKEIEHYLCHESIDVFDIGVNLLKYIQHKNITKLVFWNVESKVKLLLSKLLGHRLTLIDVSPGDYIFNEMDNEIDFQEAIYYKNADYFKHLTHFVSKYDNTHSAHSYKTYLKNPTHIIPNGVYVGEENYYIDKPLSTFKLLVCGRITPSKHIDIIFKAWELFLASQAQKQSSENSFVLEVVGSAEEVYQDYYHQLEIDFSHLINNAQIVFKGHHNNPQSIMKNFSAIVVLGTHQGSPNVVLEAAACGLPVIANDSGGTKEIINNKTGYLIDATPNVDTLLVAIKELYNNYDEALTRAGACYDLINEKFSMDAMFHQYRSILNE